MATNTANKSKIYSLFCLFIFFVICFCFYPYGFAKELQFRWDANNPSENVTTYRIYWSMASENYNTFDMEEIPVSSLGDPNSPRWALSIEDPSSDEFFYFVCTALDSEGLESVYSDPVVTLVSGASNGNGDGGGGGGGCIITVIMP